MSQSWGIITVSAVASNGVATQLFPDTVSTGGSTAAAYPPVGGGNVRRATEGYCEKFKIVPDGTNGGIVEVWDVAGLDRGATNNVNDGTSLTDAYLTANGRLIDKFRITGSAEQPYETNFAIHHHRFHNGLAVRFVGGAGSIDVIPFVENGFMIQYVGG